VSVPVIGTAAVASPAPATAAAPPAQSLLPFMLLPLAPAEPALVAAEPTAPADDAAPDDPDAPLIGWLFDSFALAATPPPAAESATLTTIGEPTLSVSASQPRNAPSADAVTAVLAENSVFQPTEAQTPADDNPLPEALIDASVEIPPLPVPNDPATAAVTPTPHPIPSLSALPTINAPTPASEPAPIDGAMTPLVADSPELAAELGERIAWQLDQGVGEATIELHPAELGALTIRIETQAQQAQVHILAAEPAARALLSQCLPQLRDLLGANGLTLTRSQVEAAERRGEAGVSDPTPRAGRRRVTSVSLVDAYA
jgi:flagellar hook-length control protein FliK